MSLKTYGTLETNLANEILYGFPGPLWGLKTEIALASTPEKKLLVIKKLIEKHLPKDGQKTGLDLQDEKILELFDKAMTNLARNAAQNVLEKGRFPENLVRSLKKLSKTLNSLCSRNSETWTDYAKRVGRAVGVISEESSTEKEEDIVLIEEPDDWHEVETEISYDKRVSSILKNWKGNPSILLETQPTKENISYLRDQLSTQVKKSR